MYQAFVEAPGKSRAVLTDFGGLNQNEYCQPNEFRDLNNLSSDAYPYLTQRAARLKKAVPFQVETESIPLTDFSVTTGILGITTVYTQVKENLAGAVCCCDFEFGSSVKLRPYLYKIQFYDGDGAQIGIREFGDEPIEFGVPSRCTSFRISAMGIGDWWNNESSGAVLTVLNFRAATVHNGVLAAVFGNSLWYDDDCVIESISDYAQTTNRGCTLLSNGAELIIMPQGVSYNTLTGEVKALSASVKIAPPDTRSNAILTQELIFSVCDANGAVLASSAGETAPASPTDGQYWIDTGAVPHQLYRWSKSSSMWVGVASTYVKMSLGNFSRFDSAATANVIKEAIAEAEGLFSAFQEGDGVRFEGTRVKELFPDDTYSVICKLGVDYTEETVNGASYQIPHPYMVFSGLLEETVNYNLGNWGASTVIRDLPVLDYYTVSKNRIWGCGHNGTFNEIRCCKLGDPTNWNVFAGASTDSYTLSIGTPGEFTGAVTYENEPYFFKENAIMKVYGDYPASYQLHTFSCEGVQPGSAHSLVTSGGYLYFKSAGDFCVFDGSRPQSISYKLGFEEYRSITAGAVGNKIYFSGLDSKGESVLLIYDRNVNAWYKETDARYLDFCQDHAGHMYGITAEHIVTFRKAAAGEGEETEWYAETGLIGTELPDQKAVSRYTLRVNMEAGAVLYLSVAYDDGDFEELYTCIGEGRIATHTFGIKPVRCDHLRLRLEGKGRCTVYSIAYTMEQRSDRP
ncbi:MAG: hypothetical protein IJ043_03085 [Clostridia bacterium]|nr:hypothetical protein [Clostridia bacterium]